MNNNDKDYQLLLEGFSSDKNISLKNITYDLFKFPLQESDESSLTFEDYSADDILKLLNIEDNMLR